MSELEEKITALTDAWYSYVNLDHHKDRDCHFYIEKVWSYGESPKYRVYHTGYIREIEPKDFATSDAAHQFLYRTLWNFAKDALDNLKSPDPGEEDYYEYRGENHAIRVIGELEAALAL